jgi:cytidyltransferase-like protein
MEFRVRASGGPPASAGILPGSYNPVTRAHLALAEAALSLVDEAALVMPRELPHKRYEGVSLEDRLRLLERAAAGRPRVSVGLVGGGLFIDMARECRDAYGGDCDVWLVCGRDAAERIVAWDYAGGPGIEEQLQEYGLLVADRWGSYEPPVALRGRIRRLPLSQDWSDVSATRVREAIAEHRPWEHLVLETLVDDIRRLYRTARVPGSGPARPRDRR